MVPQAIRDPYLDVFAIIGGLVVQFAEQTLLSVLASISELPQSIGVDVLDFLSNRSFNELGNAVAQRRISTPTHDESWIFPDPIVDYYGLLRKLQPESCRDYMHRKYT